MNLDDLLRKLEEKAFAENPQLKQDYYISMLNQPGMSDPILEDRCRRMNTNILAAFVKNPELVAIMFNWMANMGDEIKADLESGEETVEKDFKIILVGIISSFISNRIQRSLFFARFVTEPTDYSANVTITLEKKDGQKPEASVETPDPEPEVPGSVE